MPKKKSFVTADPKKRHAARDARWQAVLSRDAGAARAFCYAVRTTGIFCMPGCASRLPNLENVEFFDNAAQATAAGYRPCKRCRPDDPAHRDMASRRVIEACRAMEQADAPIPLDKLAATAGLSPSHFQRLFKQRVGISPKVYAQAVRDDRIRKALSQGQSVTRAIFDAGFGSASRFYERSNQTLGMDAGIFRKGGQGLTIRYACAESFLGPILAGFTDQGVCAIEFGDSTESLARGLRDRFPHADIREGSPELHALVKEVADFIKSPDAGLDLPLDVQGTAFQVRVWQELQNIPCGGTRTYSDIAESLGNPRAVRAVAAACAANPLAVAVPCHRVIRKTGQLAGYRWGLDKKKALLENEQGEE